MEDDLLEHCTESELVRSTEGRTETNDRDLVIYWSIATLVSDAYRGWIRTHSYIGESIDGSCTLLLK